MREIVPGILLGLMIAIGCLAVPIGRHEGLVQAASENAAPVIGHPGF